jgi:hypothetical protein
MGRDGLPPRGSGRSRKRALIGALTASALLVLALALPSGASALVTGLSTNAGNLDVMGSDGPDQLTIRFKPDSKGNPTVQIFDPQGVPDPLPAGCTRKDQFNVVCPAGLFLGVDVHAGNGDDNVIYDFGLFAPFEAPRANALSAGYGITMDGGEGNDIEAMTGSLPSIQIGGAGNDTQTGGAGADNLMGGPGNDHQSGQAGNDVLGGGPGNDKEKGGAGNDTLACGGGTDEGVGGAGKDKAKGCEQGKA